jgi:hypothetical protein
MSNKYTTTKKRYTYARGLQLYLTEKLDIERMRKVKEQEGARISVTDTRRIRNNDVKKVNVLDNHVFKSMANLLYFFEFLFKHKELKGVFDKDIEELFGLKGTHIKPNQWEIGQSLVFLRFLQLVLYYGITDRDTKIKSKTLVSSGEFDSPNNIRLQLAKITAKEVLRLIFTLSKQKNHNLANIITQDMERILVWVEYCTSDIRLNLDPPHRRISF